MAVVIGGAGAPRDAAVRRLVELSENGALSQAQVDLAAQGLGVSPRTVWRLVARARGRTGQATRPRFVLDKQLRERLAFWRGNVLALHRELVDTEAEGGPPAPSAVPGGRAGIHTGRAGRAAQGRAGGQGARRLPAAAATHRNAAWEADHVEASVEVDVEGRLIKPWVTWFVDYATNEVPEAARDERDGQTRKPDTGAPPPGFGLMFCPGACRAGRASRSGDAPLDVAGNLTDP